VSHWLFDILCVDNLCSFSHSLSLSRPPPPPSSNSPSSAFKALRNVHLWLSKGPSSVNTWLSQLCTMMHTSTVSLSYNPQKNAVQVKKNKCNVQNFNLTSKNILSCVALTRLNTIFHKRNMLTTYFIPEAW
jgi:hypothetical protein